MNNVKDVKLIKGQITEVDKSDFDIIIANINKNVLLDQIGDYAERLKEKGQLILSGFYEADIADLEQVAKENSLISIHSTTKDNWAMLALEKRSV